MSLVVADASPIRYLILCETAHVLPQLYGSVVVPSAVLAELRHPHAPHPVRTFAENPPGWFSEQTVAAPWLNTSLDLGERESIALARELSAEFILMDKRRVEMGPEKRAWPSSAPSGCLSRPIVRASSSFGPPSNGSPQPTSA